MPIGSWLVLVCAVEIMLVPGSSFFAQEQAKSTNAPLTLEEVARLAKAGEPDDVIITRIRRNAKAFDLNADEIAELRYSRVSNTVIMYLEDPTLPYSPPAPLPTVPATVSAPPALAPKLPADPIAVKVPPEPGIYYLTQEGVFLALDLKPVVPTKQPGKIAAISGGLIRGHIIGSLIGSSANAHVSRDAAVFYVRLGEKLTVDDLALLSLAPSDGRRNLDFGTKPGKPVFPVKAVHSFESKEVGTGLFRLSVPPSTPGEYLLFVLGSGDDKKGLLGKGYDFGVD